MHKEGRVALVRTEIGDVLRDFRLQKGQTLRQVAARASVALGYLSELERGQKEASSEILASVAEALEVPLSVVLREVSDRIALVEGVLPEEFMATSLAGKEVSDLTVPIGFVQDFNEQLEKDLLGGRI
jgi:transcriptional regulator with XRE-family HTH domain